MSSILQSVQCLLKADILRILIVVAVAHDFESHHCFISPR